MNKIIKDQLNKVQFADLSNFDEKTNTYIIPKKTDIKIEKYKTYIIELLDKCFDKEALININWNRGKVPTSKYYKAEILNIVGRNVQINGLAYDLETKSDLNTFWTGYLELKNIKIIETL